MVDDNHPDLADTGERRKWWMRLAAVAISLIPFLIIELALRSFAPRITEAVDVDPLVDLEQLRPLFVLDERAGRWEIPPERLNFFQNDSFPADKPAGTRRIFVLGGSTVQGRPYSIETSFATWLKLRLQAASPETTFEVVNCGGVSYASYRVAKILEEVLGHEPDAIVVYTGHNEFLEDREYAAVREMSSLRKWIAEAASHVRTVTWIRGQLNPAAVVTSSMSTEVDARLDHQGGLASYHRDPSWRRGVETHFAATLQRMIAMADQADVPLLLCVPASDWVNTPPFKVQRSEHLSTLQARNFAHAWTTARDPNVDPETRIAACDTCLAIDHEHAGANYIAGRLHFQQHRPAEAARYLQAAVDYDVCPLRATTPIVATMIELARQNDVPLLDTIASLDRRDSSGNKIPDGIVDPEFFVDHVHPSIAGHQRIASEVAGKIEQLAWFDAADDAEQRYQDLAAEHLSDLGEEYYARGRQRLQGLRRWAAGRARDPLGSGPPRD
jgi:hypothetical protein